MQTVSCLAGCDNIRRSKYSINVYEANPSQKCGDLLFGDVREFRQGGVSKLVEQLQRAGVDQVTTAPYDPDRSNQDYINWPSQSLHRAATVLRNTFSRKKNCKDTLPRHNTKTALCPSGTALPPVHDIVLMGCVHKPEGGKGLRQDSIGAVKNSRQLFCLIRQEYWRTRELKWFARYLRKVRNIHLTKVSHRISSSTQSKHLQAPIPSTSKHQFQAPRPEHQHVQSSTCDSITTSSPVSIGPAAGKTRASASPLSRTRSTTARHRAPWTLARRFCPRICCITSCILS